MKKITAALVVTMMLGSVAQAQKLEDGIKALHYERFKTAKSTFEGLGNDAQAKYWLGQTLLEQGDVAGARSLYEQALSASPNEAILLVGMGEVELMEGKKPEAKQRFETALNMTKGRKGNDPEILKAVGRANVNAKDGDANYAVQLLTEAGELDKKDKDPVIYFLLGDAYRKLQRGGEAVTNYDKSMEIDPSYARAAYRKAKLYETQRNWSVYTRELNDAISRDDKFAPAYYELYEYNLLNQNFDEAQKYAQSYLANMDADPQNDYLVAQTCWAKKDYDCAISTLNKMIAAEGNNVEPKNYKLMAYSYTDKGDTASAKQYVDKYFASVKPENIAPRDYELQGLVTAYADQNPAAAFTGYQKAIAADTVKETRAAIINDAQNYFKTKGDAVNEGNIALVAYNINGKDEPTYIFNNVGLPWYRGGVNIISDTLRYEEGKSILMRADSAFQVYTKANPDSIYGYLWEARTLAAIDTGGHMGLAVPAFDNLLKIAYRDTVKYKDYGLTAAPYLAQFYANEKQNYDSALFYIKAALRFDPTNEAFIRNRDILQRVVDQNNQAGKKPKPTAWLGKREAKLG